MANISSSAGATYLYIARPDSDGFSKLCSNCEKGNKVFPIFHTLDPKSFRTKEDPVAILRPIKMETWDMAISENSWIIEVSAEGDFEDLDPNDCDADGTCIVDGAYRLRLAGDLAGSVDPKEAALDVFHAVVPISNLDDYRIVIRPEGPLDAGECWLRLDMGVFSEMPRPELPIPLRSPGTDF